MRTDTWLLFENRRGLLSRMTLSTRIGTQKCQMTVEYKGGLYGGDEEGTVRVGPRSAIELEHSRNHKDGG